MQQDQQQQEQQQSMSSSKRVPLPPLVKLPPNVASLLASITSASYPIRFNST